VEFEKTSSQIESQENSKDITNITNVITELLLQIESRNGKIIELKRRINEYCEEILNLRDLYKKQYKVNERLIEQWNFQHSDWDKRVQEIINITQL
ncbi:8728_t:CDS:1, partial [Dentiscutata erythropus]